jgi:hypothetical protein
MLKYIFFFSPLFFSAAFAQADTTLVLSEIMFFPNSGPNEFIELYNFSETESIDLDSFKIKYSTSTPDIIIDASEGTILPPNSFAIILEGDYPFGSGIYDGLIPPEALLLKIDNNSFGSSGMANTSDRPIWLLNNNEDTLEAYLYSANNSEAISDEKIEMIKDSSSANWANSIVTNGTPGFQNSVTPVQFDLAMSSLTFNPSFLVEGDDVTVSAEVKNLGTELAQSYSIEIFNDADFDSTADPGELIFAQPYNNLQPGDSVTASTFMNSLQSGDYQIIAKVIFADDENLANNQLINSFVVFPPGSNYNDVVINEIMYAPSSGEPEWVELFNKTAEPLNIKNWKLFDAASSITITTEDVLIPANSFIVFTKDSSILNFYNVPSQIIKLNLPALNNSGDAVVINDSIGVLVDSLFYLPSWGGSTDGRSLERISFDEASTDSLNWGTSINIYKATPGAVNSLTQKNFDLAVSDILFAPPLPLRADSVSVSAKVKNIGLNSASFSLQLFEDTNLDSLPDILINTIGSLTLSAGDSNNYSFNFLIENLQFKKGFLVNAVFNLDEDTTNNKLYKTIAPGFPPKSIVINEIMYGPFGGEPEWIELFNNTNEEINLLNWSITDIITTPATVIIEDNILIPPNSFIVLTKDAAILNYHRLIPSQIVELGLPSFNNDVDGVILKDERGALIDSVHYFNQWGGINGYSLERLSTSAGSNLSSNWGSSVDIELSTPGRINSITPKQFDVSVAALIFNPRFPVNGDDVFISASIKNNGSSAANNFNVEFFIDTDSNNVVDQLLSRETGLNLASGDSTSVTSSFPITNLISKVLTAVRISFTDDEDSLNNYFERFIEPGFPGKIFIINEVMYSPADNEPEWIEIVNVSDDSINIKDWSIGDLLTTSTKNFITNSDVFIKPDEFIVIAKDTSFNSAHPEVTSKIFFTNFGTLGNTVDGIIVYDFRDGIIDSLLYRSSWGGRKGFSLERISFDEETNDSTNWTTSLNLNGSTPGAPNSIDDAQDYERNDLVINEIMYDAEEGNSDFIEFLNLSEDSVNIGGWQFEDENGNSFKLSEIPFKIPKDAYFILAADSSIEFNYDLGGNEFTTILDVSNLGLVNSGELILLKDVKGNIIDSVFYSDKWHNDNFASTKNISLERINPNLGGNDAPNWSSSVDPFGGTPGKQNSIFAENLNTESNISVSPNPFSPDNDGFEDFTIINYNLKQATAQVRIKIFDSKGRLVRALANNQPSGSSGSVIFNGLGDDGQALRIGIYIIFLEALNEGTGVVETMKTVVVVARKL